MCQITIADLVMTISRTTMLLVVAMGAGCNLLLGTEEGTVASAGGNGGAGDAGATASGGDGGGQSVGGGGASSGEGGQTACTGTGPGTCPDPAECRTVECVDGQCIEGNAAPSSPCSIGACSASGTCVECVDNDQCTVAGEHCDLDTHACVSAQCDDRAKNGSETDVDCGGVDCGPCQNDLHCILAADCLSGFCAGKSCAACAASTECQTDQYCDLATGACVADKPDGQGCSADPECEHGHCSGGVCCDVDCAGDCESCSAADTGGANGTCAAVMDGQDPKNACPTLACKTGSCSGGVCGNKANGTSCGSGPTCVGDDLKPQDVCQAGTCSAPPNTDCQEYSCNSSSNPDSCFNVCTSQSACAVMNYCVGVAGAGGPGSNNTCRAKKSANASCSVGVECVSGTCTGTPARCT